MRILFVIIFIVLYHASASKGETRDKHEDCIVKDLKRTYQDSIYNLIIPLYRAVAIQTNLNFVFSARSIWIMLAAIAEGSDEETQQQLFKALNVTNDQCVRLKLYQMAVKRAISINNVSIAHTQTLLVDESLNINPVWHNFVSENSLLAVSSTPIKNKPDIAMDEINKLMMSEVLNINLSGNSVLLDAFTYNGLWTTAFEHAIIERSPFFDQDGNRIGAVDMMKVKMRARMGYIKRVNVKVLELPVGLNGQYRIVFYMLLDKKDAQNFANDIKSGIIFEVINCLKDSNVALDIHIPRMNITGILDVRNILESLGVRSIWIDPEATKFISTPSAFPSSYIQRSTITIDQKGVTPPQVEQDVQTGAPTGLDPEVGTEFIGNQPFMFGLFDAETYTPLVSAAFVKPTYT